MKTISSRGEPCPLTSVFVFFFFQAHVRQQPCVMSRLALFLDPSHRKNSMDGWTDGSWLECLPSFITLVYVRIYTEH